MTDNTQPAERVEVTQADRDAAAELYGVLHDVWPGYSACYEIEIGCKDTSSVVQAFARHRLATAPQPAIEREAAFAETVFSELQERAMVYSIQSVEREHFDRAILAIGGLLRALRAPQQPGATPAAGEVERLRARVTRVTEDDGGYWSACSGCQESSDGYVSAKDYPRSDIFNCQPGSGCRECGGLGVLWQDNNFLAGYGDALAATPLPTRKHEAGVGR